MDYLMEVHGWEFGKGCYILPIPGTGLNLSIYPEYVFRAINPETGKIEHWNTPQGQMLNCAVQMEAINIRYINIYTEEEFYQLMIEYMRAGDAHNHAAKELSQQMREIL